MKVRLDHVTNSSTSSYVIGVHGELTKEKLLEVFGVSENSPLYPFAKSLVDIIVANAEEWSKEAVLREWDELWGSLPEVFDSGMTCYIGGARDDEGGAEAALCQMEIHYEDEKLIFETGGSY